MQRQRTQVVAGCARGPTSSSTALTSCLLAHSSHHPLLPPKTLGVGRSRTSGPTPPKLRSEWDQTRLRRRLRPPQAGTGHRRPGPILGRAPGRHGREAATPTQRDGIGPSDDERTSALASSRTFNQTTTRHCRRGRAGRERAARTTYFFLSLVLGPLNRYRLLSYGTYLPKVIMATPWLTDAGP